MNNSKSNNLFSEENRLKKLHNYQILDTPTEEEFDDIALLASTVSGAPYAFISFIDDKRLWIKAKVGLDIGQLPIEGGPCRHIVESGKALLIEDLDKDERFSNFSFKDINPDLRFFLGLPITCPDGYVIGTLCVLDFKPKSLSEKQLRCLQALSKEIIQNLKCKNNDIKTDDHNDRLVQINKTSALGMFSIFIAHEMNNALAFNELCLSHLIKQLSQRSIPQEKILTHLSSIKKSNLRMAKILDGIRTYSRRPTNDPLEVTSVKLILDEAVTLCKDRCKQENIVCSLELPKEDLLVNCHPSEIIQVLLNFINNSIDAVSKIPEKWIRAEVKLLGDQVEFSVEDSGPGITDEVAKHLMEPFFTTKEQGVGTGIGLYISKSIIEDQAGQIFFRKGKPTRFGFLLPIYKQK